MQSVEALGILCMSKISKVFVPLAELICAL